MVSPHARILVPVLFVLLALMLLTGGAHAAGGRYAFDGGTSKERGQVRAALDASAFDWSVIPGVVTVHIARGTLSRAVPGQVWLDANLLDAGTFSWAVVQEEFAHQVDFLLLDDRQRSQLSSLFGTQVWCRSDAAGLPHDAYGCERFAASLVWSYWPSGANAYGPSGMPAQTFRGVVRRLLTSAY